MIAPMKQVERARRPDVVAADPDAAGPVQAHQVLADPFLEDRAVLVVRRQDHADAAEAAPIPGFDAGDADAGCGDRDVGEQVAIADGRHPAILEAEARERPPPQGRNVLGGEALAVVAPGQAQVRQGGQVLLALPGEHPGVGTEQLGIVASDADDADSAWSRRVEHRSADHGIGLRRSFGHPQQQAGATAVAEGPRIEQAGDFESGDRGPHIGRPQDGISGEAVGEICVGHWVSDRRSGDARLRLHAQRHRVRFSTAPGARTVPGQPTMLSSSEPSMTMNRSIRVKPAPLRVGDGREEGACMDDER